VGAQAEQLSSLSDDAGVTQTPHGGEPMAPQRLGQLTSTRGATEVLLVGLRQLGQISDKEIVRLFDYDLRLIRRHTFVMKALDPEGFDGLEQLLQDVRLAVTVK